MQPDHIYHLVPEKEWRSRVRDGCYRPRRFGQDGFIHCCHDTALLPELAQDYFSPLDDRLLLLVIDRSRLGDDLRFEDPAPLPGGGTGHLREGQQFPHLYAPLDLTALIRILVMPRAEGRYTLPPSL